MKNSGGGGKQTRRQWRNNLTKRAAVARHKMAAEVCYMRVAHH